MGRDGLRRWLGQAEHTLASARHDADARDWGWAAFKAQQAAASALKLRATGELALGHSVLRLAEALDVGGDDGRGRLAREPDRHYIPPTVP
jgi:HEPN domain-containing protein